MAKENREQAFSARWSWSFGIAITQRRSPRVAISKRVKKRLTLITRVRIYQGR